MRVLTKEFSFTKAVLILDIVKTDTECSYFDSRQMFNLTLDFGYDSMFSVYII